MTAKDIKDPATRAHVKEMAVLIQQCAIKHGISIYEVITQLLDLYEKQKLPVNQSVGRG